MYNHHSYVILLGVLFLFALKKDAVIPAILLLLSQTTFYKNRILIEEKA